MKAPASLREPPDFKLSIHHPRAFDFTLRADPPIDWWGVAIVGGLAIACVALGVFFFGWGWLAMWVPVWLLCILAGVLGAK